MRKFGVLNEVLDSGNKMRTWFCVLNRGGYDQRDTMKETRIVCFLCSEQDSTRFQIILWFLLCLCPDFATDKTKTFIPSSY